MTNCSSFLFFSNHDFDKWEVVDSGNLLREGIVVGKWMIQERKCSKCGYVERESRKDL